MIEVTRFKLYPNKETEDKLFYNLHICSLVYNWCLDHNIYNDSVLPQLKEMYKDVKDVHSIVLQNVVHQIRDNIIALSEKKKKGQKVGRLRHKPRHDMIYEQSGFRIDDLGYLRLSKIGAIQIVISRPIKGEIKQIIIKHNKTHNWFAAVVSETKQIDEWFAFRKTYRKPQKIKVIGIDLNVSNFSTDSDGLVIESPRNGTTQDCSVCGKTVPKDYNSAREIKFRGLKLVGWGTSEPNFLDMRKLNTLAEIKTSILDIYDPEQVFVAETKNLLASAAESVKALRYP
jgi:transposase